jgi:hypothetical protein
MLHTANEQQLTIISETRSFIITPTACSVVKNVDTNDLVADDSNFHVMDSDGQPVLPSVIYRKAGQHTTRVPFLLPSNYEPQSEHSAEFILITEERRKDEYSSRGEDVAIVFAMMIARTGNIAERLGIITMPSHIWDAAPVVSTPSQIHMV